MQPAPWRRLHVVLDGSSADVAGATNRLGLFVERDVRSGQIVLQAGIACAAV